MRVDGIGPQDASIALVGEAPGADEARLGEPFVGKSGKLLNSMLSAVDLVREDIYITNVFKHRPPNNNLDLWCDSKKVVSTSYDDIRAGLKKDWPKFPWPENYGWDSMGSSGKYLKPEYLTCIPQLKAEMEGLPNLNVIIAAGGKAVWALLGDAGITKVRGTVCEGVLTNHKVVPTFHPAFILRGNWKYHPVVLFDFLKAKKESEFPEVRRPEREILISPTIRDLADFEKELREAEIVSVDIETARGLITHIGFAPSEKRALVVPFFDFLRDKFKYWTTFEDHLAAWLWCKKILEDPTILKLGQNFLYDIQNLLQTAGIAVRGFKEDTMIMHHSLYPEMDKSLGFMGALYTSEAAWKLLARHRADELVKED